MCADRQNQMIWIPYFIGKPTSHYPSLLNAVKNNVVKYRLIKINHFNLPCANSS